MTIVATSVNTGRVTGVVNTRRDREQTCTIGHGLSFSKALVRILLANTACSGLLKRSNICLCMSRSVSLVDAGVNIFLGPSNPERALTPQKHRTLPLLHCRSPYLLFFRLFLFPFHETLHPFDRHLFIIHTEVTNRLGSQPRFGWPIFTSCVAARTRGSGSRLGGLGSRLGVRGSKRRSLFVGNFDS